MNIQEMEKFLAVEYFYLRIMRNIYLITNYMEEYSAKLHTQGKSPEEIEYDEKELTDSNEV